MRERVVEEGEGFSSPTLWAYINPRTRWGFKVGQRERERTSSEKVDALKVLWCKSTWDNFVY